MLCPHCGTQLPDDATVCSNCTNAVANDSGDVPAKKPSRPILAIIGFSLLILVIYAAIAAVFFLFPLLKNGIGAESMFKGKVAANLPFGRFLNLLKNGNRIFRPTVVSTAFGFGLQVLYWLVPVFGLIAAIGAIANKNATRLCVAASIITGITALLTAAVVPVTLWLVPGLNQAFAVQAGILFEDLGTVSYLMPIIAAAVVLILMIAAIIVTNALRKRRTKE